jgi:hypothetical protein
MRGKALIAKSLLISLVFTMMPTQSYSAEKITLGAACKVNKQSVTYLKKTYICTKSGKKFIWAIESMKATPKVSQKPAPNQDKAGSLSFKNPMIYNVKGNQLIRKSDSGDYFESDSRAQSTFTPIRIKAYQELNPSNLDKSHPNINFIYSVSDSFPSFLVDYSKRELDEAASLWNSYFDRKVDVNVYLVTEKDREAIKSNPWLQRNLPDVFTRFEGKRERPFIAGGGGYWNGNKGWSGNIFLATASYFDHTYMNYEWPAVAKHEFVHLVQDYAFAKNGRVRGSDSEWIAIQPQNFREGSANTIGYLTAFRNQGWSSDALDWLTWERARNTSKWKTVGSIKEVRELISATDIGTPDEAFQQSYGVGALMYEWVIGTYGFAGYKKLLDNFSVATNFDQSVQSALGISKDTFYDRVSAYVYEEYSRVFS